MDKITDKPKLSDIVRRFNTEHLDGVFDERELDDMATVDSGVYIRCGLASVLEALNSSIQEEDASVYTSSDIICYSKGK